MPNHPLFAPLHNLVAPTTPIREQIQIALAIADPVILKSLLTQSIPPITARHLIGAVSVDIAVPTHGHYPADAILNYEAIRCVLAADYHQPTECRASGGWTRESKEFSRLTRYESDTIALIQNATLAPTVSTLTHAGFAPEQVEEILRLPNDACHKSWWYALDSQAQFSLPFLRLIRTLRYPDGTYTIQYKDYFEQDPPGCFHTLPQKVKLKIKPEDQSFGEVLARIKQTKQFLGISQAILICNTISEIEAQGFINQGISIYPAAELILPSRSDCNLCVRRECPMNGFEESPVAMCYGFLPL